MNRLENGEQFLEYRWEKCYGADILVPTPNSWTVTPAATPDALSYLFRPTVTKQSQSTGYFLAVFPKILSKSNLSPEDATVTTLRRSDVSSEIEIVDDDTFLIARADFVSPPAINEFGIALESGSWTYMECAANKKTHTFYRTEFTSPLDQKSQYEDIARTMIERKVLNPYF